MDREYDASLNGTKLESKSGVAPLVNKNISTFRTYVTNNNAGGLLGYQLLDIHAVDIIHTLFCIEFATLDSQSIMAGFTATSNTAAVVTGKTDLVTTESGSITSNTIGKYSMKYRGIENFWGNIRQFVDGINVQNNIAFVNTKPSTYASDIFAGDYKQVGYTNTTTDNYITEMGYDVSKPYIQLPTVTSTTNTYGDYCYQATGNRIALLGGNWNSGSAAGAFYWSLSNVSNVTSLSMGSRVLKKAL
jgi:hypothetical protein